MSVYDWRDDRNIYNCSATLKTSNHDSFQSNRTTTDDIIIVWCDTSANVNNPDNQYEAGCLNYIDKCPEKKKLLVIVSGSLGQKFVPKICHQSQIHLIYVFCGRKANHESWARKFEKIKGVYDKILELRTELEREKENLEKERMVQMIIDFAPKLFPSSVKFSESINSENSKYDNDHQANDDMNNSIHSSETITPYIHYKQQMEFADTGIWPCVSVISSARNSLVNHLYSTIGIMQYFNSSDHFLQHFHNHPIDPHFIVLSNPASIEQVSSLIHRRVRRLYIYCSNNRLQEYDIWREKCPQAISVLQHFNTLTSLILWDLSSCIVDIANYYDEENKKDLAQTRYRYAYRLHHIIQGNLNNRIEMIEYSEETKSNN